MIRFILEPANNPTCARLKFRHDKDNSTELEGQLTAVENGMRVRFACRGGSLLQIFRRARLPDGTPVETGEDGPTSKGEKALFAEFNPEEKKATLAFKAALPKDFKKDLHFEYDLLVLTPEGRVVRHDPIIIVKPPRLATE